MEHTSRDPVTLLRFAIDSGDRALVTALVARFSLSQSLSRRAMRDLAQARARSPSEVVTSRTLVALVLLLGLDNGD
ncbi:MAG: hypothetical protein ACR2LT_00490 [Pyrinomonadaceae bacterium]